MLPHNHTSLVIADGRRAKAWELGLRREGLRARRIVTLGSDAEKGEFYLVVPDAEVRRGQRFVSDVLAGGRSLPAVAPVSGPLLWGAGAIVIVVVTILVAGWLS